MSLHPKIYCTKAIVRPASFLSITVTLPQFALIPWKNTSTPSSIEIISYFMLHVLVLFLFYHTWIINFSTRQKIRNRLQEVPPALRVKRTRDREHLPAFRTRGPTIAKDARALAAPGLSTTPGRLRGPLLEGGGWLSRGGRARKRGNGEVTRLRRGLEGGKGAHETRGFSDWCLPVSGGQIHPGGNRRWGLYGLLDLIVTSTLTTHRIKLAWGFHYLVRSELLFLRSRIWRENLQAGVLISLCVVELG